MFYTERPDLEEMKKENPWKYQIAVESNEENVKEIPDAFKGADVVIGMSRPRPGVIKKE